MGDCMHNRQDASVQLMRLLAAGGYSDTKGSSSKVLNAVGTLTT